jgi:hypothetical protein
LPALAGVSVETLWQILARGLWQYLQAELEQELMGKAFLALRGVLPRHPADQPLEAHGN